MNVNVNVNRKYKINGKEYNSIEEMPPDLREAFEKALASQSGKGSILSQHTKIIFNGIEYKNIEEMPQDVRELYEKVLKTAETGEAPPGFTATDNISGSMKVSKTSLSIKNTGTPIKTEPVFSARSLIIGIALITLIVLLYIVFQGK